jgi:hypothetical protein
MQPDLTKKRCSAFAECGTRFGSGSPSIFPRPRTLDAGVWPMAPGIGSSSRRVSLDDRRDTAAGAFQEPAVVSHH